MSEFISKYEFGDISVNFILNNKKRAVMILLPNDMECDFFTEKNITMTTKQIQKTVPMNRKQMKLRSS